MKFKSTFSVPYSGTANPGRERSGFKKISGFDADIDFYTMVRHSDCTLRGYTDDEDADLILKNVTRITCIYHDGIVAEVVVSEKLIIRLELDEDADSTLAHFHFYIHEKRLRFGKLLFLRPEDIV